MKSNAAGAEYVKSTYIDGGSNPPSFRPIRILNGEAGSEKSSSKYYDLAEISGYKVSIEYSYTESAVEKDGFITIEVPKGLTTYINHNKRRFVNKLCSQ